MHAKPCRRPSSSLWRQGRGFAGVQDIYLREFVGWRSALWYSFLLLSLPLLQRWSPLLASICSVWFSAWLYYGGWWSWSFGNSSTAAGCLSWEVWWLRTGSIGLAIFLTARSCCRLSWESSPKIVLSTCLGQFCWHVVDSGWFHFLQRLYCCLEFFAKDGVVVLCVCLGTIQYWWISVGLVIVQLRVVFCPSVQYLSFFCEAFFWTILDSSSFLLFHSVQDFHEFVSKPTNCCSSSNFL